MGNLQVLDGDVLRIRVHHGFESPFLEYFRAVRHDVGSCGSTLRSQGSVVVHDVERSEIFNAGDSLQAMLRAGARACQSTPIFAGAGAIVGVLSTHHDRPRAFDPHELLQIKGLAEQASRLLDDGSDRNRIALAGEWDLARKAELERLLSELTADREATIDLRECTYADSTVLGALAAMRLKFAGVPVTLLAPSPQLRRLLTVANFDSLFRIV